MWLAKMFSYQYLTEAHLKGFTKYKYSAVDTSPVSYYVTQPFWNFTVKFIPKRVAPNLLTFGGFLCMVTCVLLTTVFDWDFTAAGRPGVREIEDYSIPNWIFTTCGILLFLAYNLDGLDGKQARRIGVSGPLGELFDHGLDSYIVFFIPYCLISVFGRDEWSLPVFRGYIIIISVLLNFYISHWEKYNTGTLYMPWGYDLSMWASTIIFLIPGMYGPAVYKIYVIGNITFVQALEVVIHSTGLFTTLPVAIYNVYLSYKNKTGKMYPLMEALRPIWPMLIMTVAMTVWAVKSPNDVLENNPRVFLFILGTIFSNIASRLIVAEITDQSCDTISWINIQLILTVTISLYLPQSETAVLYMFLIFTLFSHIHYGVCVVRQLCSHFGIKCFTVPKEKRR